MVVGRSIAGQTGSPTTRLIELDDVPGGRADGKVDDGTAP